MPSEAVSIASSELVGRDSGGGGGDGGGGVGAGGGGMPDGA